MCVFYYVTKRGVGVYLFTIVNSLKYNGCYFNHQEIHVNMMENEAKTFMVFAHSVLSKRFFPLTCSSKLPYHKNLLSFLKTTHLY